jgi:hypothetical protein
MISIYRSLTIYIYILGGLGSSSLSSGYYAVYAIEFRFL